MNSDRIKLNIHVTESCNYRCRHCFAHFEKHNPLSKNQLTKIIDNVAESSKVHEINFAGGEPMMLPYLHELAEHVNRKGLTTSLITNGSLMTDEWIIKYAGLFRTIGFSVDSFSAETSSKIGRCTCHGEVQSAERIAEIIRKIKLYYPDTKIKMVIRRL